MKKCPYCAEEIQDEAVKCKHCGEWLRDKHPLASEQSEDQEPESVEEPADKEVALNEISEPSHDLDAPGVTYVPLQEKSKWGWGWLVLIAFVASLDRGVPSYESGLTYSIRLFGIILIFCFYFWYRNRLIKRNRHATKVWPFSLRAGFFAYILATVLVLGTVYLGAIQEGSHAEAFFTELMTQFSSLNQEELKIVESLESEVQSEENVRQKLEIIDEYLDLVNRKSALTTEYVNFCQQIAKRKDDKRTLAKVNQLRVLADKNTGLVRKSLLTLRDYYETEDENLWYAYEQISLEQETLQMQYRDTVQQLADMLMGNFQIE